MQRIDHLAALVQQIFQSADKVLLVPQLAAQASFSRCSWLVAAGFQGMAVRLQQTPHAWHPHPRSLLCGLCGALNHIPNHLD
jgi:hypothetical protein